MTEPASTGDTATIADLEAAVRVAERRFNDVAPTVGNMQALERARAALGLARLIAARPGLSSL